MLSSGDEKESIDSLLVKFFKFYSNFSFEKNKISIYHGKPMPKVTRSCLEIENPTNSSLNVAKNVSIFFINLHQLCEFSFSLCLSYCR